jgi:hypothetical protein
VNQGLVTETFNVTLYANGTEIGKLTGIVLPSGNSATLTFVWNTTGFVKGPYTMSAVASTVEGETDTVDNTFSDGVVIVTIQGDVDGDGDIDAIDLADLSDAYGSTPELPNWNATCDIDGDNLVDIFDLFNLGKNFGEAMYSLGGSNMVLNLATSASVVGRLQALPPMLLLWTGYLMTVRVAECFSRSEKTRGRKLTN